MQTWSLQEEILSLFHRWYILAAIFAVFAALGFGIARIIPVSYQAETQLYIGLEAYRAYSDPTFSAYANQEYTNLDDYKNWQMAQLNELIFASDFITETQQRLKQSDSAWENGSASDLRAMLRAEWRTAGKWSLIAEDKNRKLAVAASATWSKVVIEKVSQAIASAQEMIKLDIQLQETAKKKTDIKARLAVLQTTQIALKEQAAALQQMAENQPLQTLPRDRILALGILAADNSPAWQEITSAQPSQGGRPENYITWIAKIQAASAAEIPSLNAQLEVLEKDSAAKQDSYKQASKSSRGISPNLQIEELAENEPPDVSQKRPTGIFPLVGGILGVLLWLAVQLVHLSRRNFQP
jgi:hypothetical protein